MNQLILLVGIVLISCALFQRLFAKTSVPGLLLFILLGMLFGADGLLRIDFNDYELAGNICTAALILIMYYGGMGTNIRAARPVLGRSMLLSSLGTFLTAGLVTLFAVCFLGFRPVEGFLLGSVICSTDAASVFSILRSRKMNLRYGTASLLEIESGSNDPFSFMLTVIALTIIRGNGMSIRAMLRMLLLQVAVGVIIGLLIAWLFTRCLPRLRLQNPTLTEALLLGTGFFTYAVATILSGNGFLGVYLAGILIGNGHIPEKAESIRFFDGLTGIMQMLMFFLLGLLAYPSRFAPVAGSAFLVVLILTFFVRPMVVFLLLRPFGACNRQIAFVAFAGMRGAASIAFTIMAGYGAIPQDLFHIVFFIVLFSILVQGSLIPFVARRLDMICDTDDVMETFNDYTREIPVQFVRFRIQADHPWVNASIASITLPPGSILVTIKRGSERIVPNGSTILEVGDEVILCGLEGGGTESRGLYDVHLTNYDDWTGKKISELALENELIVLVKRGDITNIPTGDTLLAAGDDVYILRRDESETA